MRIGYGYDAHRLVSGRPLYLGGVLIPHSKGLLGHSDADCLIHAVIDALLGAACLGDIGTHFPSDDEKYRDISSLLLLRETGVLLKSAGYGIVNIDATIIAQSPKLMNYISEMREKLSNELGIEPNIISIKATTTEGLGFEGREDGISASAVCIINS